jgi:Flp pilus assembly protein CpaB
VLTENWLSKSGSRRKHVENITSSKLFRTRQGTLVLGVVAAVLAAIVLLVYLNSYRNSVNNKGQPLSVLVAKNLIQKGVSGDTVGSSGLYKVVTVPKSEAKTGAFVDPSSLSGTVALANIYPGQQLTDADFGVAPTGLTSSLSRGQRAVVVPLDSPSSVGGQITAGDFVDVWVLATSGSNPIARELLQKMYVMNLNGGNVTLRATPTQAGELIFASNNAKIWLTLRPPVASLTKPPVISTNNLLGH